MNKQAGRQRVKGTETKRELNKQAGRQRKRGADSRQADTETKGQRHALTHARTQPPPPHTHTDGCTYTDANTQTFF